jgi:hypothetical protein
MWSPKQRTTVNASHFGRIYELPVRAMGVFEGDNMK